MTARRKREIRRKIRLAVRLGRMVLTVLLIAASMFLVGCGVDDEGVSLGVWMLRQAGVFAAGCAAGGLAWLVWPEKKKTR